MKSNKGRVLAAFLAAIVIFAMPYGAFAGEMPWDAGEASEQAQDSGEALDGGDFPGEEALLEETAPGEGLQEPADTGEAIATAEEPNASADITAAAIDEASRLPQPAGDELLLMPQAAGGHIIDMSDAAPPASGEGWTYEKGIYTILDEADVIVTGSTTSREIRVAAYASAHVTLQGASIDSNTALWVLSPASLRLTLVGASSLKSSRSDSAGISVRSGADLTIDGTGSLTASGGVSAAGIGGSGIFSEGDITIDGGVIHALGGESSDGIGAGMGATKHTGTITINGGVVSAARGEEATFLKDINASSITINGGSVSLANGSLSPQPKNSGGANVYLNALTVGEPAVPGVSIVSGAIGGVPCDADAPGSGHPAPGSYGIHSVSTDDAGKVYFWLPAAAAAETVSLTASGDDVPYKNSFIRAANNSNAAILRQVAPLTPVTFTAEQAGGVSGMANSTAIQLTFSKPVTGLSASDITLTAGTGTVVKGTLSGSGSVWTLALSSVTAEGTVLVSIGDLSAFTITNNPQSVTVYKDTRTWAASVDQTGMYKFPEASVGYDNTGMEHIFTVTNTGNQPLTGVRLAFAGTLEPFEVSTPLASDVIPVGDTATFGVRPNSGRSAATYADILRVYWMAGTAEKSLNVILSFSVNAKKAPTAADLDFEIPVGHVYTGSPQGIGVVSAAEGVSGLGQISVSYAGTGDTTYEKSATPPTNAGTYAVTADIAEGTSYTAASDIPLGSYTIAKATQDAPPAPTLYYKTPWSIAFVAQDGYEYCVGYSPTGWMSSWTSYFEIGNLSDGYAHECYQRLAGDANHEPSPASEALVVTTGWADTTPPTGAIKLGTHTWSSFIDTITFGLFYKNTQNLTIEAADDSGDAVTVEYCLSDAEMSEEDLQDAEWVPYSNSFTIQPGKYIVYARISDVSGNSVLINSGGIVVYTDSEQDTAAISFTKGDTEDATAGVVLNGNTVAKIMCDSDVLASGDIYTVSGETITFKADYLDSLAAGGYLLTIQYDPQGVAYPDTPETGSEAPQDTSLSLTILPPAHVHEWKSVWSSDASSHWHECIAYDGAKAETSAHTPGDWSIDRAATATIAGSKHKACMVCGYVTETLAIPATGTGSSDGGNSSAGSSSGAANGTSASISAGASAGVVVLPAATSESDESETAVQELSSGANAPNTEQGAEIEDAEIPLASAEAESAETGLPQGLLLVAIAAVCIVCGVLIIRKRWHAR